MFHSRSSQPIIEALEARIAPALAVLNPLADLTVGPGKTGADIDLSRMFDPIITDKGHTIITLTTNFDGDPNTPGIQASSPIVIELFDDLAPLSVQNFISYLTNPDPKTNYTNTFFHRSVAGFVVQGGGFDAATPGTHIPTQFDVHNEFDGVNRSNLAGTIAMAKSLGPNTASSEWFFNLADNSGNLDNQNGGFTVFAKVLQGMDVVNAIAGLTTYNFSGATDNRGTATTADDEASLGSIGGALNDLPLQNFNPNPDNNPNTPAPLPTADNYVRVTGFTIQKPPSGTLTGVTYSVNPSVDIVDATTGAASDLVTATVTGSSLHLDYKAHAAGSVRVTVHGSDGVSSAADTFLVNLQPNLVASFEQDPFDGVIVGGDTKTSTIIVGNNGGGWAVGNVNVKVYLSKLDSTDSNGALLEPTRDLLIANFANQPVDLANGGTLALTKSLQIPRQLVTMAGENYRVLVEVTPSDAAIAERFTDDNVALDAKVHTWENRFGTFTVNGTTRTDAKLVFQEADGDTVQLSMTRAGNGLVTFDGTFTDVAVVSPRPTSALTAAIISNASVGQRDIDFHNVELLQYVRTVQMPQVNLTGLFSAAEGFRELHLGNATGPGTISIGKVPAGIAFNPTLTFGDVADFNIESLAPLRLVRAASWTESDSVPNHITAPSIGSIAIRGNLEANVTLTSSARLGLFYVAGFFKNSTLTTFANVDAVTVGSLDHANIFLGTRARPDDAGDFRRDNSLGSLTVRGVAGAARSFIASNVAAAHIGSIFVTGIDAISSPAKFGIVADSVRSYERVDGPTIGALNQPGRFDGRGRYSLTIV